MKKKGFATSAIMYTMLLLFLVLLVGILNNLQNKKTILDQLKTETISALESDSQIDYLLGTIENLNSRITELENTSKKQQSEQAELIQGLVEQVSELKSTVQSQQSELTSVKSNLGTKWTTYFMNNNFSDILDCNDLPLYSIGFTYPTTKNSPGTSCTIVTVGGNNNYKVQMAVCDTVNTFYVRAYNISNGWGAWTQK